METQDLITIKEFCIHYNVPHSFIDALRDYELIEVTVIESNHYIKTAQINDLEKMMRLHFDLEINFEGLDVVDNLLRRVKALQNENTALKNRLSRFEDL